MVKESGTGIVTINNGEVTNQIGLGTSTSLTRSQQSGTSLEEQKTANSYTAVSGESSSRAMSTDTSYSMSSGAGGQSRTNSIGQGTQLVQVESSGSSIAETFDATAGSSSRATSSGSNRARQMGTSSGSTNQGQDGVWSNMVATTLANASSDGTSSVTTSQMAGDSRSTSTVNSSTNSRTSESFTGTVNTDSENRTSRNGTAKSDANVTAEGDFTQRNNYVGGDFPTSETITGNWENKFDFNTNGEIDADHERVKRSGDSKTKKNNKENVKTETTASYYFESPTGDWVRERSETTVDTNLTDEGSNSRKFNSTVDLAPEPINPGSENPVYPDPVEENDEEASDDQPPVDPDGDDSQGKMTDKTKVTEENWRNTKNATTGNTKNSHNKTITTDTNRVGDSTATNIIDVSWEKESHEKQPQSNGTTVSTDFNETGQHNKTFTSHGNEPGDKQTLKITSRKDSSNVVTTPYVEPVWGGRNFDVPISGQFISTTRHENSSYEASHQLASDGVSPEHGQLTASYHQEDATEDGSYGEPSGWTTYPYYLDHYISNRELIKNSTTISDTID
jgi:hypothetical protein